MPFAPGHFQERRSQGTSGRRFRSRREQLAVRGMAVLALVLIGVVVFSLASHDAPSANGCINFSFSTMIGGSEKHACGSLARELCATPPSKKSIDGDFQAELYTACRKAGIPVGSR